MARALDLTQCGRDISHSYGPIWEIEGEPLPVSLDSFAEYAPEPNAETKKDVVWFALNDDRPLARPDPASSAGPIAPTFALTR